MIPSCDRLAKRAIAFFPPHLKTDMMTRTEHLEWAKNRALEYARAGHLTDATSSLMSDLNKHLETKDHPAMRILVLQTVKGAGKKK